MSNRTTAEPSAQQGVLMKLDPATIHRTALPNRDDAWRDEGKLLELRRSIRSTGGNLEPIKVRVRPGTGTGENNPAILECVFGHLRLKTCAYFGFMVNAIVVTDLDDKAMLMERIAENRGRSDYTPIEQGRICLAALAAGHYKSQAELADDLGLDASQVTKGIQLARLPAEVFDAFAHTSELTYHDAKPLTDAVKNRGDEVIQTAVSIAAMHPRPPTKKVIALLVGSGQPKRLERFKTVPLTTDDQPFGDLRMEGKKLTVTFADDNSGDVEAFRKAIEAAYGKLLKKRSKLAAGAAKGD